MGNKSKHNYGRGDNVTDIFKNLMAKYVQEKGNTIPNEKIEQAFAIIDTHTRLLDNMTMINNYNMSIQVISALMMQNKNWHKSEDACKEIIESYFNVFIDINQDDDNIPDVIKTLQQSIKSYVMNSCMVYYAVYHKDRNLLKSYNKLTEEAIRNIIKSVYTPKTSSITTNNTAPAIESDNNNEEITNNNDNKVIELKAPENTPVTKSTKKSSKSNVIDMKSTITKDVKDKKDNK